MLSRMFKKLVISWLLLVTAAVHGQSAPQVAREWTSAHRQQILDRFTSLLSIPNVASDTPNIRRNADALLDIA